MGYRVGDGAVVDPMVKDGLTDPFSELHMGLTAETLAEESGNASGVNDGAAVLIVCDQETARQKGWTPLARLTGFTTIGCDPARMGLGPVHATRKLCQKHGLDLASFDTVELNEAFAAQALACIHELGLDETRVSAIATAARHGRPARPAPPHSGGA